MIGLGSDNNTNENIYAVFMSAVDIASVAWAASPPQPRGFLFVPSHGQVEQEQDRNVFVKYLVL